MPVRVPARLVPGSKIMIVGEAPGRDEEFKGSPFVGASGQELDKMLMEAGIARSDCSVTNVCKFRPPKNKIKEWFYNKTEAKKRGISEYLGRYPDPIIIEGINELITEIEKVKPNVIIACGDTPLWALRGEGGIGKWRGSELLSRPSAGQTKLIPVYHPAAILRNWSWRAITVLDLKRAKRESATPDLYEPPYNFTVRPSFTQAAETLNMLLSRADEGPLPLAWDLETRLHHIACCGIAWSDLDAICIPLMCTENHEGYWMPSEEIALIELLFRLAHHPNVRIIGQNFLYDMQYLVRYWGFHCDVYFDTMLAQHVCFPGIPKALDFICSMYLQHYTYWKDEGKEWGPSMDEDQLWEYNCKDAVGTFASYLVLERNIEHYKLQEPWAFQMKMFWRVLKVMLRGIRVNTQRRATFQMEVWDKVAEIEQIFINLIGERVGTKSKQAKNWYRSTDQQKRLFYEWFGIKPVINHKTGRPTVDDDALTVIAKREPLVYPITFMMKQYRSLGVYSSTFLSAGLGEDGRIRSSYNLAGTETFRLSSSKDAFGSGANLQNIPRPDED